MSIASLLKSEETAVSEFEAYVCDDQTTQALVPVLNEREWHTSNIKNGGIENAIRTLATATSPRFLVVDLSKSSSAMDDMNALAEVCEPGTMVIAIGQENDIELYRNLIGSGVQEYLVKPVTTDQIRESILAADNAMRLASEPEVELNEDETDKLVAVVGIRGGVGASTVASSCAWILSHDMKRNTGLLDMDIYFGTDALTFDLEPGRGLCDALENPSRIDGLFIERAMVRESENLSILGAEASLNEPTYTDPAAMSHLLSELKHNFSYIVLDLPRNMAAEYPLMLSEADEIILVTDLSLAAARDTIRFLALCKTVAPSATIKILLNKVAGPGMVEVDKKDFEASIERAIDWEIPFDPKLMVQVSRSGKPLPQAAKMSKVVKVLKSICDDVTGNKEDTAKGSIWSKLAPKAKK
ncbi:cellulose synthase operon protein YhjQ/BcsQ [Paremcibacter congregatus]|uniref:Pilus assembly protein CpaE n=1 Tax=Paremcibacter congregatus TaxID=2043170 RepID=A0A2G4YRA7_9PROT|nr:cellulose synthase operon protein YhjQ/BcsQ [Paremcibacter congregatus]PHZ84874.1 pilus assembly protein CpaE [Paremcibacter congregatus]QDE26152.1 pilus assembly protein CpaE [Paremcibacter congregatus]